MTWLRAEGIVPEGGAAGRKGCWLDDTGSEVTVTGLLGCTAEPTEAAATGTGLLVDGDEAAGEVVGSWKEMGSAGVCLAWSAEEDRPGAAKGARASGVCSLQSPLLFAEPPGAR